jgi:hypothetical protein
MALTGRFDGPPRLAAAPIATAARAAVSALVSVASASPPLDTRRYERSTPPRSSASAPPSSATRAGRDVGRGTCDLLRCADGWIAVNLARPEDIGLLPVWLGEGLLDDPRAFVAGKISHRNVAGVVERGRLLGLPVAPVATSPAADATDWLRVAAAGASRPGAPTDPPLVVDLSSLWAGPLCTHLLALAGAHVVKIESTSRPDGARRGPSVFFDLINGGKRSVALDFASNEGVRALRALVDSADIVVESSRPRALRQLGISAEDIVATRPAASGQHHRLWTWRANGEFGAFGDDAAAAGGLVVAGRDRRRADLLRGCRGDPLTAMHAALAALSHWQRGGGALLDVALQRVATIVAAQPSRCREACRRLRTRQRHPRVEVVVADERCPSPHRARDRRPLERAISARH